MMPEERRQNSLWPTRGHTRLVWDLVFRAVRWIAARVINVYATFGILILGGGLVAIVFTYAFARLAAHVMAGSTLAFDDSILRFAGAHQTPWLTAIMLEITSLGTGIVVALIVAVSALFLFLHHYRQSATLLLVTTLGGIVLNTVLKLGFNRPRPQMFAWGTHAMSSSFPSGHAMSAAIVYPTVAYLASRAEKSRLGRLVTMTTAAVLVVLICISRVYLGVHYPSDVVAGVTVGLAWAAFCMATLEAAQLYARRNAPSMVEGQSEPSPAPETVPSISEAVASGVESGERRSTT
jgi:undecaprenyl-diphosphatase